MASPCPTLRVLALALAAAACASAPAKPPMTFAEAGLAPARDARPPVHESRLGRATDALLEAIERETGEKPLFDVSADTVGVLPDGERREARRHAAGWAEERANLAMELNRAVDAGATVREVKRARAALLWDELLGARWTEVDRKLVDEALARSAAALPQPTPPASPALQFAWPVSPVLVTSPFGLRNDPLGEGTRRHSGIDLAAAEGQPVSAAAAGTVVFAGWGGGYGLHVELKHADGVLTRYAHLSEVEVHPGDEVPAGSRLGLAGRTGRATGPHLHFEVWRDGLPVDPTDELDVPPRSLSAR